ncbi:Flagellar basal body-associated protein FliL [Rubellimicrobium thermophilum DSM 16684]|uniref:Flagellar protein FliL n=1 Tax=Rubellimicrobium thermophilum DSM 16684 TaxID=1123069 RepID=S9SD79_9RHOB|nr:Flagellar basal body-associated protein FliL [Rubellimicrobium thermophilum DSM 16684]
METAPADAEAVNALVPRIVDVLNGYLRAVSPEELAAPDALLRLRSQMLRRVQVVAGGTRARDLLVMEFVLN